MRRSLILLISMTAHVAAQPAAPSAEAEALFDQAVALRDQGKLAEACSAFEASQKLAPAVSTLLNLADCREQTKQYATAYGLWRDAMRQTRTPDDETQRLHRLAKERATKLEGKLSKLQLDVARRVPGLQVLRDGVVVDPVVLGRPLPVDGGTVTIEARAEDHEPWRTTVEIATEGDFKTVAIPALIAKPRAAVTTSRPSKVVPIALAGGAVVLLGSAIGLDLAARSQYRKSEREPDDFEQESLWEGAKTKRFLAQGLAVAGVGAAGVAVWLYLRAGKRTEVRPGLAVQPVLDGDRAGVQLQGRF